MPVLRLTQFADRIELSLEGDGPRRTAVSPFKFALDPQDQEDLRWYLEDYLQYPFDPAPRIADRIERRIAEIGTKLFAAVFHARDR